MKGVKSMPGMLGIAHQMANFTKLHFAPQNKE